MSLNLIDYFMVLFIVLGLISGLRQGFIRAVSGFIGVLAGIMLAWAYYDNLAWYMEDYYGAITLTADFLRRQLFLTAGPAIYVLDSLPGFHGGKGVDPPYYLASLMVLLLSFLLILMLASKTVQFLWNSLGLVFDDGILGGINRLTGMLAVGTKNFILLAVFLSFLSPLIKAGSEMGISGLKLLAQGIENSYFANIIFKVLNGIKEWWLNRILL